MKRRFLTASLALWRKRLAYRQKAHDRARKRRDKPGMAKRDHLIGEAVTQIKRRKVQLAALPAPDGLVVIDGKPVVAWIAEEIRWAQAHGWRGAVVSGYRTHAEQYAAAVGYVQRIGSTLAATYPSGVYASNHCRKGAYPAGAVDVTDAAGLDHVLRSKPNRRLTWGGPVIGDTVHFSANGH